MRKQINTYRGRETNIPVSHAEARALGSKVYKGRVCSHCGFNVRWVSNRHCAGCLVVSTTGQRKRRKRWYDNNRHWFRARNIAKKYTQKQATPAWANQTKIARIYARRKPGQHVDHIVPLMGIDKQTGQHVVCGLHVDYNLRIMSSHANQTKWAYWP